MYGRRPRVAPAFWAGLPGAFSGSVVYTGKILRRAKLADLPVV